MSYCAIIVFKDSKPSLYEEFRNSWGGAARIWTALYDFYLKDPATPHDSWMTDSGKSLWALADDARLSNVSKSVLLSTFDRAVVFRGHFDQFTRDLRTFDKEFTMVDCVSHLGSWARFIDSLESDREAMAVGFHGTSCGEDLFSKWDEETDEEIPYDLDKEDKHFSVYAEEEPTQ